MSTDNFFMVGRLVTLLGIVPSPKNKGKEGNQAQSSGVMHDA